MKTAEEWKRLANISLPDGEIGRDFIKQIQLDAWKQGMTDAEQICMSLKNKAYGVIANKVECSNAILNARDNKTEF